MDNKEVAILMSTYNGEKYLRDQVKSILEQTYRNWHLYIRDDGSTDETQSIISEFETKYPEKITFFNKDKVENKGVVKSFMEMLAGTEADFYMFSDQDDVWKKEKVAKSVKAMLKQDYSQKPICIHTDLQVVNANLEGDEVMNGTRIWHDFQHLLFSNCITGCTMMVNQVVKSMMHFGTIDYDKIYMHDWWIGLICAEFGEIVYLNDPLILYRQHGDNVVGSYEKNTISHYIYRIFHQEPEREHMKRVVNIANEFDKLFGKQMQGKDYEYVHKYGSLTKKASFLRDLVLGMKLVPQRMTPKGKLFFTYLITVYNQDLKER
ncbi:glycosyltransferase family 2 protein [Limosilactobacillus antri]|uniref:glycosyltransferase family 2 protein n=1 Tax=Limosilactobacillus antri TaxID=227943 RepID=UPI001F584FB8|nr:glycosyltransferase family 2 protein [Limosilactobacillus antri]